MIARSISIGSQWCGQVAESQKAAPSITSADIGAAASPHASAVPVDRQLWRAPTRGDEVIGNCDNECWCNVEATDGLEVDGTGTPDDPFIVSPAPSYSLVYGAASAGTLPSPTALGQLAFEADTHLFDVWNGTFFEKIGPEWRSDIPGAFSLNAQAANSWLAAPTGISVPSGWWVIASGGYVHGTHDPPDGTAMVDGSYEMGVEIIEVALFDHTTVTGLVNEFAALRAFTIRFDGGNIHEHTDYEDINFYLHTIVHVPDSEEHEFRLYARRDNDFTPQDVEIRGGHPIAVRLANHDFG